MIVCTRDRDFRYHSKSTFLSRFPESVNHGSGRQFRFQAGSAPDPLSGDYTLQETRVPIPNTTVKLPGPMIVPTSAKVGYCRDFSRGPDSPSGESGPFFCACDPASHTRKNPPLPNNVLIATLLLLTATTPVVAQQVPNPANASPGVSARLLASLPRLRSHQSLLNRAKRRLDENSPVTALRLLQALLDSPADSFLENNDRIQSARQSAWSLIRNHPSAGPRRYAELYNETAAALLRRADAVQGSERLERLRRVAHRFRFTRAGFQALNRLATTWLDQGAPAMAARGFLKLIEEPSHQDQLTPLIHRKAALAIRLSGRSFIVRGRPRVVLPRGIPESESRATVHSTTDWLLPLGSTRTRPHPGTSQPRLIPSWDATLVEPLEKPPLVQWFNQRWADSRSTAATALFPIIAGEQIVVRDQRGLRGLSLKTGTMLWQYRTPLNWQQRQQAFQRLLPVVRGGPDRVSLALGGNPRFGMITSDGRRVFAVQLAFQPTRSPAIRNADRSTRAWPSQLVAVTIPGETSSGGAGSPNLKPSWIFPIAQRPATGPADEPSSTDATAILGSAVPAGGQLLVLAERRRQVELIGLSPISGQPLWRQPLANCDAGLTDAAGTNRHAKACLASQAFGLAVCPTGTGVTVTVDLVDGTLQWAHDSRDAESSSSRFPVRGSARVRPLKADPGLANLPLLVDDRVILLSPSASQLVCLELESGRLLWSRDRAELDYVATAGNGTLLVVGHNHVLGLDLATGALRWQRRLGLVSGRGTHLANGRYLVPLKSGRIICLELADGRKSGLSLPPGSSSISSGRGPLGVPPSGGIRPGNLVAGDDWILSLSADRITAYPQAAGQLARVRIELAAAPGSESLRLEAAELAMALGQFDQSRPHLETIIDSSNTLIGRRARELLRELLYLELAASPPDAGQLLQRLRQLSTTPRQRARVLVEQGRWHSSRKEPLQLLAITGQLEALQHSGQPAGFADVAVDRDGVHIVSRPHWITAQSRHAVKLARQRDTTADRAIFTRLERQAARLVGSGRLDAQLAFSRRFSGLPLADTVRLAVAGRLIEIGRFQQAELLLLAIRHQPQPGLRLAATIALVQLWNRLGLLEECGPLLDELASGPLAIIESDNGVTGRKWVADLPQNHLALATWRRHRSPTPRATRVEIRLDESIAASADLSTTYQRYRRRFSTSEQATYDLLETYTGKTRRVTLLDRQVGVAAGHVDLPSQFSVPTWWHQVGSGHLLPLGSHSAMMGLSLLEHSSSRPLWNQPFQPLTSRQEMMRVGPAGVLFCSFQSHRHLVVCRPIDGEILWRRGDLEKGSGSFADAASGLFGDQRVLVVCAADRIGHDVFDTVTGDRLRHQRLPITPRTRRRAFGRHLMYVTMTSTGQQRMRVWDPLDNRTIIDELLKDRIFPTATQDHQLSWIDSSGRLKIHDLGRGTRKLDVAVLSEIDDRISSIKVFRDRDCWYLAMLPSQGAAPRVLSGQPVFFVGDTLLPVSHIHGHFLAINADRQTVRWRRKVPLRSVLRFRRDHLPALVLLGRTRDRGRAGRQRMLLQLLDARTGHTLLLQDDLPPDRIVQAWYDPAAARLELRGLKSRIEIAFQAR